MVKSGDHFFSEDEKHERVIQKRLTHLLDVKRVQRGELQRQLGHRGAGFFEASGLMLHV